MLIQKYVTVEGKAYPVTLSDDSEALQAAYAAGGAIIGIWSSSEEWEAGDCLYLTDDPENADRSLLERAVRRRLGLPFLIGETERLIIREFQSADPLEVEEILEFAIPDGNRVFCSQTLRDAYIANQYRFCECGLWALEEKENGCLVGKAGITDGNLGYHIYKPYRRRGYALEACRKICSYAAKEMELETLHLITDRRNGPSIRLAERLGFTPAGEECGLLVYRKRLDAVQPDRNDAAAGAETAARAGTAAGVGTAARASAGENEGNDNEYI